jgi:Mor family transcriptional regulator
MVAYNFTKQRKKIYQLHVQGMHFRDIAKEVKMSGFKVSQVIKRIEEKLPKQELEKFKAQFSKQE